MSETLAPVPPDGLVEEPAPPASEVHVEPRIVVWSAVLSLYWVAYLWGFWTRGIHALGINATLFLVGVIWLVVGTYRARGLSIRSWRWITPFALLASSFAVHDNTYVKTICLFLFPIGLGAASLLQQRSTRATFVYLASTLGLTIAGPALHLKTALVGQARLTRTLPRRRVFQRNSLENRVLVGVALAAVLVVCFVVPLLAAADDVFSSRMQGAYDFTIQPFLDFFDLSFFGRAVTFVVLAVLLVAWTLRVTEAYRPDDPYDARPQDSVIAGIVLTSVGVVYLLFLWVQVERFWLGTLPDDFDTTARLVKSGFWQMIALTAFNLVLQISTYRRTNAAVQRLLFSFGLASTLLLASAAHRMYLYVTIYGFSHEKYFACYAVVYCACLLLGILWLFVRRRDADLVRIAAFAALWVFSITAVLPIERLMFRVNLALARAEGSRINVDQMELFGADVYPLVREHGRPIDAKEYFALDERTRRSEIWIVESDLATPWRRWCEGVEARLEEQKWYERSLASQSARAEVPAR